MTLEKRVSKLEKVNGSGHDVYKLGLRIRKAVRDPEVLSTVSEYILAGRVHEACAIMQPYFDRLDEVR